MILNPKIDELKELVKGFPQTPGVYLMRNAKTQILYVGKAKNLRSRVRSYFNVEQGKSGKTWYLVQQIVQIEFQETPTEVEAFLLEASLIKKHRPRYNIRLKDDKSFPYIRCDMNHDFPRFYLSRRVTRDGAMYFGPFTNGQFVRDTIQFIQRNFKIRDCSDSYMKNRKRPCMTHQIGRCTAPCVGLVSKKDYAKDLKSSLSFLRGEDSKVLKDLNAKMKTASKDERYEAAARFRDSIQAVGSIWERQFVMLEGDRMDRDVVVYMGDGRGTLVEVLNVRGGRMIGSRPFFLSKFDYSSEGEDPREWLVSFLNQYYQENMVPEQILLPTDIGGDMKNLLGQVMKERQNRKPQILENVDRDDQLMKMALDLAQEHWKEQVDLEEKKLSGLEEIQNKLSLPRLPERIECFDISNFQGSEIVASQVVFEGGRPKTDDYRRYKIKSVSGEPNDYQSMKEVLSRRLRHVEYEDPDLLLIDGGKGQLNAAMEVLRELERVDIPIASLAKAKTKGEFSDQEIRQTEERFFIPGRQNPITFKVGGEAFQILVGLRDEAHRFAITYHRKLRGQTAIASILDEIVGLGESRKKALLKKFGSVEGVAAATVEQIAGIRGFNAVLAERILLHLQEEKLVKNHND